LEWSLYCCDELTGFIVAVALVRPDKKLASVTVDSVLKKWGEKAFAAGVKREQIEECEDRLGIPLKEFIEICLQAMQGISKDLGL
jgi:predicted hydrolase (HD superfamily)